VQFLPEEHGASWQNASDGQRIDRLRLDDQGIAASGTLIIGAAMFRFTIREILLLTAVAASLTGWWLHNRSVQYELLQARHHNALLRKIHALTCEIEDAKARLASETGHGFQFKLPSDVQRKIYSPKTS
jgi:hypothetical protein